MKKQKVIFSVELDGDKIKINLEFKPGLAGEDIYKKLSKEDKYLQNTSTRIARFVMESLEKENKE